MVSHECASVVICLRVIMNPKGGVCHGDGDDVGDDDVCHGDGDGDDGVSKEEDSEHSGQDTTQDMDSWQTTTTSSPSTPQPISSSWSWTPPSRMTQGVTVVSEMVKRDGNGNDDGHEDNNDNNGDGNDETCDGDGGDDDDDDGEVAMKMMAKW
eukprot:TRINITY_DN5972_c0_g1_i5.p1 TRINITY_DN5972_c0_g1~~TRINITY_DN5972_c0_g1_i5.p1  ORF type:complete len:153 (-),score=45.21 TRINITY_DN5972_c0_g1_i5:380-838(-)